MSPDDRVLFLAWSERRDAEAFNNMARRYAGLVYGTCIRVLKNPSDAEDVAQECFERLAGLRRAPSTSLAAYLHAMAFNRSIDRLRSERRRADRETRYVQNQPPKVTDRWDDLYEHVDAAIAGLPARLREPVIAHFLEGKTHEEIARREGVSRPAVTQRIQRGVEQIRERLRKQGIAVGGTVLAALLAEHASGAAPAAVLGAIGKLSVAGAVGTAATGVSTATLAYVLASVVGVAAIVGGGMFSMSRSDESDAIAKTVVALGPATTETSPDAMAVEPQYTLPTVEEVASEPDASVMEESPTGFAVVHGRVFDEAGNGVAGAQLTLRGGPGTGAFGVGESIEDGYYRIERIAPASAVNLQASLSEPVMRSPQLSLGDVRGGEDIERDLVVYDLSVEGRVVDRAERDLATARILAFPAQPMEGSLPSSDISDDGGFLVTGLPPGDYDWRIKFPGGEYRSTGQGFTIQAGRSLSNVVVTIGDKTGYWIAGTVYDSEGSPLPGAYVRANMSVAPFDSASALTGDDGAFLLEGLSAGDYFVRGVHADFGMAFRQNTPAPSDDVRLVLPRRGGLNARIVDSQTGAPVTAFDVFESKPLDSDDPVAMSQSWEHYTSSDGVYVMSNLLPQSMTLRIRAEGYAQHESELTIPAGEILETVISLEQARGLEGRVVDGAGNPIAGVQFFEDQLPAEFEMDRALRGRSDGDGRFNLDAMTPGDFVLIAYHFDYAPVSVAVKAGQEEILVRMSSGATARCTITSSGTPYADVRVHGHYTDNRQQNVVSVQPDESGVAILEHIAPDAELYVMASAKYTGLAAGDRDQYVPVTLRDGEVRDVSFHFVIDDTRLEVPVTHDGVPQPGLYCWVKYDYPGGAMETVNAHTDDQGKLLVEGLPIGPCTLYVMPGGVTKPEDGIQVPLDIQPGLNTAECAF